MADPIVFPAKRDRRGGWNRHAPTRDDGAFVPPAAADEPVAFINRLTHTKGKFAGQPFNLRPWQRRIITQLFKKRPDGRRQYRTCLLMLPRKNGKTELAAGIALYGLAADGEAGAEVYSAAADRDQAGLVFGVAAQMVRNDAALDEACYVIESQKRIVHPSTGSVYRAIAAEAHSKHGFNASMVIYDELHAAPDRRLYDVLSTSMGAREQPLLLVISTAGFDRHSILWELYQHAKKVQERPALDPTFLPILYEAPEGADWTKRRVWRKANPALGDFRSLEEMQTLAARAKAIPAQENTFRRLYLNQWTEQAARWIQMPAWDACLKPVARQALAKRRCYVGMDLSTTTDLTALVAVFPDDIPVAGFADPVAGPQLDRGGGFDVLPQFFVPEERIRERSRRDHVPYDEWARQGVLTSTPGAVVDYDALRQTLRQWAAEFSLQMIAFDPWNATDLVSRLQQQDGFPCVSMRQGFASLSAPTKSLEQAILGRRLRHDGHPVLRWNVSNVAVETDAAGNLRPNKDRSTEKIDGVVALIMAVDLMNRLAPASAPTYEMVVVG
jgi:phage terminase large subunit-like protein